MSLEVRHDLLPQPGDVIADQYEIESLLGRGGMGAVFAGKNVRTGRAVAIKWMLPQAAASAESVQRFIAEARATARIEHPNVVHIYDWGNAGGSPYLVMERLRGCSLREHLDEVRVMRPADAIRLLVPAMRGVAEAHREAIIHRDIKPDNIFLCRGKDGSEREAKVVDFGISKLYDSEGMSNLTGTGMMMGTPAYMSPEQLNAPKNADASFDVYAFGVVFYEALTGRQPYEAEGIFQLVAQIMTGNVTPPSQLAPGIPPQLDAVVLAAMNRDANQRFASMQQMIDAFEQTRPLLGDAAKSTPGFAHSPYRPDTGPVPGQMTPPRAIPATAVLTPGGGFPMTQQHATPGPGGLHKTAVLTPNPHGSYPGMHGSQPGMHGSQPGMHGSQPGVHPGVATPLATPHAPYGTQAGQGPRKKSGFGMFMLGAVALLLGGLSAAGTAFYLSGRLDSETVATETSAEPAPEPEPAEPVPDPSMLTGAMEAPQPEAPSEPSATTPAEPQRARPEPEPEPVAEPEPEPEPVYEPVAEPEPEPRPRRRPPRVRQPPPQPVVRTLPPGPSTPTRPPPRPRTQQGANGAMIIQ